MHSHDAAPASGEFPEMPSDVSFAAAAANYQAIPGLNVASLLSMLLPMLGAEVNPSALMSTVVKATLGSRGDKSAILRAVVANADQIFPDARTRPWIVDGLNAFAGGMQAHG